MRKRFLFILMIILVCVCLSGCSSNKENSNKGDSKSRQGQGEGEGSKSKDPKPIFEMQKTIDQLFSKLSGIPTKKEQGGGGQSSSQSGAQSSGQSGSQSGGQSGSGQGSSQGGSEQKNSTNKEQSKEDGGSGGGSGSGSSGGSGSSSGGGGSQGQSQGNTQTGQQPKKQEQSKPSSILLKAEPIKWEETYKMAEGLHETWNSIDVDLIKNNVQSTIIEGFSNNLNDLTNKLIENDRIAAMKATNNLYYYIPFILASYEKNEYMDLLTADYNVRGAYADSEEGSWEDSLSNVTKAIKIMENIKNRTSKENVLKLDMSIREMSNVINTKNQPLVRIKAKLVFENFQNVIGELFQQES